MNQNKNRCSYAENYQPGYSGLKERLRDDGALDFSSFSTGLFPASSLSPEIGEITGMGLAWLRDSCHIANGLWISGDTESAARTGQAVLNIFNEHRSKINAVANGDIDPADLTSRLPIRVDGETLAVVDAQPQVQNDAIGYSLWLTSRLINEGALQPNIVDIDTLAQITRYLRAIRYWEDADSGHWEEELKVNASSIGTVVAGLKASLEMFEHLGVEHQSLGLEELIGKGQQQLDQILPFETQTPEDQQRRYDAALLFLVEPLNVVSAEQARLIIEDISEHLIRDNGIIRYQKDTYWGPNFRTQYKLGERATYAPGRLEERNTLADKVGQRKQEAQWTLFDPLLSVYWGKRFLETGNGAAQERQLWHLNRSLSQLAPVEESPGKLKLPEAYFLEDGQWVPNDHTPLLWGQANMLLALNTFEETSSPK